MLSINTNLSSLIAQNSLKDSTNILNQAIERMTTGYKINHASDNAANYSIATNMATQIGSYNVAADNVVMGMDLVTTASDTISLMQNKAERLRALCIQARNGTYGAQSLSAMNAEANAIMSEINRLYSTAEYNGVSLFTVGTSSAESTPEVATFDMIRSATTESYFISDPITYTDEQVAAMTTMTQFVGGTTSADNTYSISTKDELVALADYVNAGNDTTGMTFVLGADIDLSSISNWTPIGDYSTNTSYQFKGTFDGNGHVIKNLTIDNETKDYQGLFGYVYYGEITNVGVQGGIVKGKGQVGGLVGYTYHTDIINSYSTCDLTGNGGDVGGLVGKFSNGGGITNCYATGSVIGNGGYIGGLVGHIFSSSPTITNSYATGTVTGTGSTSCRVGGLVGYNKGGMIQNCYATGDVDGSSNSYDYSCAGGLVGRNGAIIQNCYATGNVKGGRKPYQSAAGLCQNFGGSSLTNSYSTGVVTGTSGGYTNSDDWDGTCFTYGVASFPGNSSGSDSETSVGGNGVNAFMLQVGLNGNSSSSIGFDVSFTYDLSLVGADLASDDALNTIDDFINMLSAQETKLGAVQNRLESALESIEVNINNLTSSLSTIRDADIAEVSAQYIQQQILQQAAATLLATANQSPSIALQLI